MSVEMRTHLSLSGHDEPSTDARVGGKPCAIASWRLEFRMQSVKSRAAMVIGEGE